MIHWRGVVSVWEGSLCGACGISWRGEASCGWGERVVVAWVERVGIYGDIEGCGRQCPGDRVDGVEPRSG